ncbi:hypothetical protein [Actinoplanes sp. HUAS TT8]|uniref:hypothetical protein n=1 Tax=Actinoplanes sp. HUAS TT8 TaxID=3447453 RepID=UPI003F51F10B
MLESALVALLLAVPAPATGTITFTPADSIDLAAIKVHTSGGCPAPADGFYAVARGHGFPKDGQMVTAPTTAGMSATEGFDVYFAQTMADFAKDNSTKLSGRYDVTVYCVEQFSNTVHAEYRGAMVFSTPNKYKAAGGAATQSPAPVISEAAEPPVTAPAEAEAVPTTEARPAATGTTPSPWWLVAGLAVVLLAFEAGRRFGRRSRTP